ncbi:MAG: hypothetical protein AAGJ82_09350 [Bacteroidota bacterium]
MSNQRLFIPGLLVVMLLLLWWRLPDWFTHGNTHFIEPWGDGYKAYHAIFYHAEHDTTYSHFLGMNYPYGEHVVPGACQPVVSNTIRLLTRLGWNVQPYKLGILHGFLLLGVVLCALFLYLIFVRLKLPSWYGFLLAIPLTFLAPQQARLIAHYGLAHPELLPILYYLLLRWHERRHWGWSLAIGLVVGLYSGVHFYFFAIASFAVFGWVAVRWLARRDWAATLAYLGHGLLMLGLPLMFYLSWMILPDPVTDRNKVPWGFFEFRGRPTGVFTDLSQPHWQLFDRVYLLFRTDYEAQTYVGLIAIGFFLFTIVWLLTGRWLRPRMAVVETERDFVNYLYTSSIPILVFSCGVPFIFSRFADLLPYLGPIQQFRSIGRFAWVFYYAVNIAAFYYLWQWLRTRTLVWRVITLAVAIGILYFESYHYHQNINLGLDPIENWADGTTFPDKGIDYRQYQACVPIPYFNIGSDNFWWQAKGWISQKPHTLSMQTGLPLTSAMLTRTSLQQTLNQLQLVTEPYRLPRLLNDLPNDQPLLLFWDNARVTEYGDRYLHLRSGGTRLLYENDWLHLYELPLASFAQRLQDRVDSVEAAFATLYVNTDSIYLTDSLTCFLYEDFDDHQNQPAYRGTGEFRGLMPQHNVLVDRIWDTDYTGLLNLSFWMYLNADRAARATITWEEYDAAGELLGRHEAIARKEARVFDGEGWALLSFDLIKKAPNSRVRISIINHDVTEGVQKIDDLLLRPSGQTVAWRNAEQLWWNNRTYDRK